MEELVKLIGTDDCLLTLLPFLLIASPLHALLRQLYTQLEPVAFLDRVELLQHQSLDYLFPVRSDHRLVVDRREWGIDSFLASSALEDGRGDGGGSSRRKGPDGFID